MAAVEHRRPFGPLDGAGDAADRAGGAGRAAGGALSSAADTAKTTTIRDTFTHARRPKDAAEIARLRALQGAD